MSKIFRRKINADSFGNIFSASMEQLTDDENGTIEETYLTAVSRCEACGRPIEKTSEIRVCISCGASCCTCGEFCTICGRGPFCGHCKTGFPEKGLRVCPNCLPSLQERLAHQDQLLEEKANFERTLAVYHAQIKLAQVLQQNKGKISNTLARIAQLRVARKIARLEQQVERENNRGRKLLP